MVRHPTQQDLDFVEAERERSRKREAERREDELDRLIGPVIERLGPKHFVHALGLGIEDVCRIYQWRQRRNGQRPPAELLLAILIEDEQAMAALCDLAGYETPRRKVAIPPEELVRRYRAALLQFGAKGEELDRQVRAAAPARGEG
jgi:hypothetical protein